MTYMSASIQFFDCRLSLIHIPLQLYPHFVQPILSLILPPSVACTGGNSYKNGYSLSSSWLPHGEDGSGVLHDFVNISITPIECSVVCSKRAAEKLFTPLIRSLSENSQGDVIIVHDFLALQVDGEGLDAGRRVLDLTSPLAFAGISIFFITTYFSDYILVPARNKTQVMKALERQGFIFEQHSESFVTTHHRSSSSGLSSSVPSTPVPTTLEELEAKTFTTLKGRGVVPRVHTDRRLILCAGRKRTSGFPANDSEDGGLYLGLVNCIVRKPRFFSVTITNHEPASLLLERDSLGLFGGDDVLLGSRDDVLIPIILDLRDLPVECTGIVCGVAGRLVGGARNGRIEGLDSVEMSYLSTARAGTVMVAEQDIKKAIAALVF